METFNLVVQDFAEKEKQAKKSSSNKDQPQVIAPVEDFEDTLFQLKKPETSVEVEIRTYFKEDTKPKGTNLLAYWAGHQKKSQSCPKWLEPSWPFQLLVQLWNGFFLRAAKSFHGGGLP